MLFQHKRMHYPFELSQHTRYNDHGYLFFCRPEPEDANIVAHNVEIVAPQARQAHQRRDDSHVTHHQVPAQDIGKVIGSHT